MALHGLCLNMCKVQCGVSLQWWQYFDFAMNPTTQESGYPENSASMHPPGKSAAAAGEAPSRIYAFRRIRG
jgi:hypothetical protein